MGRDGIAHTTAGSYLGNAAYSNAIQDLNSSYLDDLTLGGPEEVIAQDVQWIIDVEDLFGLHFNICKCELISSPGFQVSEVILNSFSRTSIADAALLGAPLLPGVVLGEAWAACSELSTAVEKLKCIGSQDILLCSSFSTPRVQHFIRCLFSFYGSSAL